MLPTSLLHKISSAALSEPLGQKEKRKSMFTLRGALGSSEGSVEPVIGAAGAAAG
jgi:hypothetical protein